MDLEIISEAPRGQEKPRPILFVHGANSGAWVWDVHFMPYFAERGWPCHALSLRGHGKSGGAMRLMTSRVGDYVEDLASAIEKIGTPPILVGHSMGAILIQHYLVENDAPAAIFMAPVPPSGLFGASMGLMMRDPHLFASMAMVQSGAFWMASPTSMRRALFSDGLDHDLVREYFQKPQAESPIAVMEMMGPGLPRRGEIEAVREKNIPMLVLGAENDAFFPGHLVAETAEALGVDFEVFPGMAHAMMLEPDWEAPAARMAAWLEEAVGGKEAA